VTEKPVKIAHFVAAADNDVIGIDNDLPWHLPKDLKYFRDITRGHPVIMGRKTWESLPEKFRPLPGRDNIIVTTNPDYTPQPNTEAVFLETSIESAIERAKDRAKAAAKTQAFIIGGGTIYEKSLALVDQIYLTRVHLTRDGHAKYPPVPADFSLTTSKTEEDINQLTNQPVTLDFQVFERAI